MTVWLEDAAARCLSPAVVGDAGCFFLYSKKLSSVGLVSPLTECDFADELGDWRLGVEG